MLENPYSPPTSECAFICSHLPSPVVEFRPWTRAMQSVLFSVPGGVAAGVIWGSGVMSNQMVGWLAYLLIGTVFGLCIALTLISRRPRIRWMKGGVIVVGGSFAIGIITAVNQAMRSVGWHLVGQQFPWIWAVSTMLPILASVGIISVTLRCTQILTWRQTVAFAILSLPITAVAWGAIDVWMLTNNSFAAHYRQRVLMFIAWFVLETAILSHLSAGRANSANKLVSSV